MKLWDYIKGSREGKNANRIEKDAMKDPFLAEALEGFDLVNGNHIKAMEQLRKQIKTKAAGKKGTGGSFRVWGVVAAVMVAVGAGAFFLTQNIDSEMPKREMAKDIQPDKQPEREIIALRSEPAPISPMAIMEQQTDSEEVVTEDIQTPVSEEVENISAISEDEEAAAKAKEEKAKEELAEKKRKEAVEKEVEKKNTPPKKEETKPAAKKETVVVDTKAASKKSEAVIRGWVTDKSGNPLKGASVFLGGTKKATVTDEHGQFELAAKKAQNIQVNYLGYRSKTQRAELNKMTLIVLSDSDDAEADAAAKTANLKKPVPAKGEKEYQKYIEENLVRPKDECVDVKGEVVVAFTVDGAGRPYKIRVVAGLCPAIDREAIRLIRKGPDWKRGDTEAIVRVKF